jgi:cytochrome c1
MNVFLKIALLCSFSALAWGAEGTLEHANADASLPAIERGAGTLMETCHACHSLKYIKYRDLIKLGIAKAKVDEWRGDLSLDTPLMAQMSEADAISAFNKVPPDLSLMAQARDGGPDYLYSYLIGYFNKPDGTLENHIFEGTKMPDILGITTATDPAARTSVLAKARDITSFLTWAADPHSAERITMGKYIIGYLVLLTGLLYLVKRQIWAKIK